MVMPPAGDCTPAGNGCIDQVGIVRCHGATIARSKYADAAATWVAAVGRRKDFCRRNMY